MQTFHVRPIEGGDKTKIADLLVELWGSRKVVTRGKIYDAAILPGFLAIENDEIVGLVTLHIDGDECEVITLDAFEQGKGIGSFLLKEATREAHARQCRRLWLITSNDNIDAIAFYQRRGLRMVAIYPDAITEARKLKPQIPLVAENGIPIRDEVEFEVVLSGALSFA